MAQTEEEYLGYAEEAKNLAVDVPDVSFKDAATFVASATPIIGDAMAAKEVYDELQKDDPNYYLAGALGGAAIVGLIPGIGNAAANAIKAGARKALDVGKRIEVDPNALGVMGGNVRLKTPVEEVTPQVSNIDYQKKMAEFDASETADDWQTVVGNYVTESRDVNPTVRTPELEASAKDLIDDKITREQHLENVDKYKPVEAWDALPREPSSKATVFSLNTAQRKDGNFVLPDKAIKNLNVKKANLKVGDRFLGRLDIPAYKAFDTWIIAGKSPKGDAGTTYAKAIHYEGSDGKPVIFRASQGKGEKIGMGKADPAYTKATHEKTGYATVDGVVKDLDVEEIRDKAAKFLEDPEWTQVGFDPRRQGGFYVRSGENKHVPIREADEVIQIGPLVLAKNAKLDMEHTGYNEGGVVDSMDKEMNDMLLKEQVDPVSGNTAPVGALPSEVRDDIDIRVSEGEFVVNAQTVRYFGEEFFNELQEAAEQGFERIKEGDELPFRDDELDVDETEDQEVEPEGFAYGGAVKGYAEGDRVVPEAVGGGYGAYGGTGATFSGFQSKSFINDETGQKMLVFFFNGRPLKRIPSGFREMGATPVEEQAAVQTQAESVSRDDGNEYAEGVLEEIKESGSDWRTKDPSNYSINDFAKYADSYKGKENPLELDTTEKLITNIIGGPIGLLQNLSGGENAVESLIKKQKTDHAKKVNTAVNNILRTGEIDNTPITGGDNNILFGAQFEANRIDATANPFGQTVGTPLDEQSYFKSDTPESIRYTVTPGYDTKVYGASNFGISGTEIKVPEDITKSKESDILKEQTITAMSDIDLAKLATPLGFDMDGDGESDLFAPEEEEVKPVKQGKYDPTSTSAAGGYTNNTLTKKEQDAFDHAVDSDNSASANHYVAINRLRNKQDTYAAGNMTRAEGAAMGLSSNDMDQADKYGGSVKTAIATGTAVNQGIGKPARVVTDDSPAGSDEGDKDADSCVIATHGISTGGFSFMDKAKAELWCERTYHGKWYGEAFRRGYRHAGNKAIEKGKAADHYKEFKDFVSYGRGLKKGLKPAINYYLRTTQFFLTGLFVK